MSYGCALADRRAEATVTDGPVPQLEQRALLAAQPRTPEAPRVRRVDPLAGCALRRRAPRWDRRAHPRARRSSVGSLLAAPPSPGALPLPANPRRPQARVRAGPALSAAGCAVSQQR